jgi:UDP-glucose:(heptosyl)LPS alpha-1,3-glucosyltransferase
MRVALAHKRLDLNGGTERDLYRTAEGLDELGHEVHLFCCEYGVAAPPRTFSHRVPFLPLGRTARLWSFAVLAPRIIERFHCDIVIGFGRMLYQDILRSGGGSHRVFLQKMQRENGVARALWHRISPYHRSVLAIEKRQCSAGNFKRILCVSKEVEREFVMTYSVAPDNISVIYNGVDEKRFHPSSRANARERIRKQWGIPMDAPVVLFVGSGFRRKGLDRLLKIWGGACLRGTYLLVVGEDAQRNRYRSWSEREAKGRVLFTGRQREIENYYGAADLVALPAVQEAFGNVVLEALASGLPVVVSGAVGAGEILKGELAYGVVDRGDDPRELEAALLKMLELSRLPHVAAEARKLGEVYSWENHFRTLEKHLVEIVGQNRHGANG